MDGSDDTMTEDGARALPFDRALAEAVVAEATARYIASRRAGIDAFVDRTFSLAGALELHSRAAGWDLLRAPANLALAAPYLALQLAGGGAKAVGLSRAGRWLQSRRLFLTSAVAREVEWRLMTEFLELPYAQPDRSYERDALAEMILADPRVEHGLAEALQGIGRRADDPRFRQWLTDTLASYASTRVAAADMANALISAGVGAVAFKQLTPGMLSLGPALAHAFTQWMAVSSFPLGAAVGSLWYGALPASASVAFVAGVTGTLMGVAAMLTAFSGILTDPLQRRLGIHRRRLRRMVDALERELTGQSGRYVVRDHYVARILDLFDVLRLAYRPV